MSIAGHRDRGRCRRHRHSGILYLSPVPQHFGTGLGPLIPVPNWSQHRHFSSFRYRTDRMQDNPTFRNLKKGYTLHVHAAGSGNGYTLHVHTAGGGKSKAYTLHTARPYSCMWKWLHPARPFCWLVKGHTLHVHTDVSGKG
jgi:hypothetical protein